MGTHRIYNEPLEDWSLFYDGPKFHAVLCDPPYDLGFMGKDWDKDANFKAWGEALMPHLLPGAVVLMFGGTRTWHRLAVGMEDVGFEMWDTLMWLYGSGFPKAQKIDGWNGYKTTALKPAWEPVLCFKKPLDGTYAETAVQYGSGCLNIDGARIPVVPGAVASQLRTTNRGYKTESDGRGVNNNGSDTPQVISPSGRYPANLLLDEESAVLLDEQSGVLTSGKSKPEYRKKAGSDIYGKFANVDMPINVIGDSGGASRFFYCAKASAKEKNAGLDGKKNPHPTVKPISLIEYLAKLLLPPDSVSPRRILVPFSGSGSEMIGCLKAGWDEVVGVEKDETEGYVGIAEKRINYSLVSC